MSKKERKYVENGVVVRKIGANRAILPYEIARETIQRLAPHVKSANKYRMWRKATNSKFMPAQPHKVYDNFSWRDFLGSENKTLEEKIHVARTKKVRDMWSAIKWAQAYCQKNGINTVAKWWEAKQRDSEIPNDIPMRPDLEYSDFPGYPVWVGKTPLAHLEAAQHETAVLVLVHPRGEQENVVETLKLPSESELRDMWGKQNQYDRILGCWKWESELESDYNRMLSKFGGSGQIIVPNLHELTWELNSLFEIKRL